jgi:hypothetical protein
MIRKLWLILAEWLQLQPKLIPVPIATPRIQRRKR